jgi:DNA-binding Lrp family transcriptional regulator
MNIPDEKLKAIIGELVMAGDLDGLDIAILRARDCSPMPTCREVASELSINNATVVRRMQRIKALFIKEIAQNQ